MVVINAANLPFPFPLPLYHKGLLCSLERLSKMPFSGGKPFALTAKPSKSLRKKQTKPGLATSAAGALCLQQTLSFVVRTLSRAKSKKWSGPAQAFRCWRSDVRTPQMAVDDLKKPNALLNGAL
jgi:hypothetical protein